MIDKYPPPSFLLMLIVVYSAPNISLCPCRILATLWFGLFYCISLRVLPNKRNVAIELKGDIDRVLK